MSRKKNRKTRGKQRRKQTIKSKAQKGVMKLPRTARQYFSKPKEFQETWDSVAQVISRMRSSRISLRKAAREFGIDPNDVIRLGRSALRKHRNGRYAARKSDQLLRILTVLTAEGRREIALRDSREASIVGSHWAAVQRYLQTGDDSALKQFHRKKIKDAARKSYLLLTDLEELDRLGSAGVLSFESLYGRST